MTLTERRAAASAVPAPAGPHRRTAADVLFVVVVCVLLAVHLTIFIATLVLAPVTIAEQRGDELLHLPVAAARLLVLPFHALLLGCLYILGRRAAGRWAGFGSMLAVLALNLRADPTAPVYGPPTASGGWIAASLIAAAFVVLPTRRAAAAALVGAAVFCDGLAALALPAFLVAVVIAPSRSRWRAVAGFAGVWAVPVVIGQLLWIGDVGVDGWAERIAAYAEQFAPHAITPFLEQQRIVFAAWHFPPLVTFSLALVLFVAVGLGLSRYFLVPGPGEVAPSFLAVLRRFPVEMWAASLTMLSFGVWWALSGATILIDPMLPALAATAPLLTAMAYRGAKWLLTLNRFWQVAAVLYLTGLILARSTQLVITLVQAFVS